jgi:hypothetical protein
MIYSSFFNFIYIKRIYFIINYSIKTKNYKIELIFAHKNIYLVSANVCSVHLTSHNGERRAGQAHSLALYPFIL